MSNIIGYFTPEIIAVLGLEDVAANTPIYIGSRNIEHMKRRHPAEYEQYHERIKEIIAEPDYIGIDPKDGSIEFVKEYIENKEYIQVAVRITNNGKFFARTLFLLSTCNAEGYIANGTLKRLTNSLRFV